MGSKDKTEVTDKRHDVKNCVIVPHVQTLLEAVSSQYSESKIQCCASKTHFIWIK